jgi:glycosyltransferase involved in cell wall biosynthesis
MRLVIVTPFLETRGGLDRVILKIAQRFDAKLHCIRYNSDMTFPEFKGMDIEVAKPGFMAKVPILKRVTSAMDAGNHFFNLKLDDYDVINAHQTPSEWVRNRNKRVIWYCHSPNREAFDLYEWRMKRRGLLSKPAFWASIQAFKALENRTVPNIEYVFTNSLNSQSRIKKYLKRDSEVLYPAVDAEKFRCRMYENFFFCPSRIAPEKDFEYAIEAFKLFSNRMKGWKLVIAGALSERKDHHDYLKKLRAMGGQNVIVETNVTDERLLDLYSRCSAVLFTPINEDYGLVPLEAMASSKPCIAKNEGGPKETIIHGKDGFLVPSMWKMADAMQYLANHPEKREEMGKSGRKKVLENFTWEKFMKRFEEKAKEVSASS